MVSMKAT